MDSRRSLLTILAVACISHLVYGVCYPAPPHSSHDAFLLIPQFQKILLGYAPGDTGLGTFHPTWFSGESSGGGWRLFGELFLENNRGRHWTQLPHPIALSALAARFLPSWFAVQAVFAGYLCATLLALYGIGCRLGGERVGVIAALSAAGFPAVFGFARYLECHLPVAALCTVVVWLLLRSEGLTRWRWCLAVSLVTWSLTRTGEGAADLVGAGLVLVGPAAWTAYLGGQAAWSAEADRARRMRVWFIGLA
ncbi:MAG: hypothetical protein VX519_00755, partial [Myxococcota bacterium]|nr:hypothetical protein [Myxococcota bacterium]